MAYLQIHVHYHSVGDAFDAIRARDDLISWAGCSARFSEARCMGINPLKALSRQHLEEYLESGLRGRVRLGDAPEYKTVCMILRGEHDDFATELAFRFGNGLVRRTATPDF